MDFRICSVRWEPVTQLCCVGGGCQKRLRANDTGQHSRCVRPATVRRSSVGGEDSAAGPHPDKVDETKALDGTPTDGPSRTATSSGPVPVGAVAVFVYPDPHSAATMSPNGPTGDAASVLEPNGTMGRNEDSNYSLYSEDARTAAPYSAHPSCLREHSTCKPELLNMKMCDTLETTRRCKP